MKSALQDLAVGDGTHYALDVRRQGEAVVRITPEGRVILRGQEIDMQDDAAMAEAMRATAACFAQTTLGRPS